MKQNNVRPWRFEMSTITKIFILSLVTLLLASCSEQSNPTGSGTSSSNQIMPLAVGNSWTTRVTFYDTTGAVANLDSSTIKIVRDTTIQNEKWFADSSGILYTNRSDGLWMKWASSTVLVAKYPASLGDTFTTGVFNDMTATVLSMDTSITVPKGTFRCYRYRAIKGAFDTNYSNYSEDNSYFSLGIGLIKWEDYLKTRAGTRYRYAVGVLTAFVLK
jgi:hypothetical protein